MNFKILLKLKLLGICDERKQICNIIIIIIIIIIDY